MAHDPHKSHDETEGRKRLMALMTRHQRQIFSYIYVLVPNRSDAEDLLQETSLVICEKFHEFKEGTDFVAWACQIAYWRVRYSRQKFARSKVVFDQELLDVVAQTASEMSDELDQRQAALGHWVSTSPDARQCYIRAMALSASLCSYASEIQTGEADGGAAPPASAIRWKWMISFLAIAACLAVMFWVKSRTPASSPQI